MYIEVVPHFGLHSTESLSVMSVPVGTYLCYTILSTYRKGTAKSSKLLSSGSTGIYV